MTKLFKSIYVDATYYSRDDLVCSSYGRVVKDGGEWQAIRKVGGSSVITRHDSRKNAESKLETGNEISRAVHF